MLLGATLIRAVLLSASMKLLGDWNWHLPSLAGLAPHLEHGGPLQPARPDDETRVLIPAP